jgi:hypothetical protein
VVLPLATSFTSLPSVKDWGCSRSFVAIAVGPCSRSRRAVKQEGGHIGPEIDRYWNAIVGHGGAESQCGWCKDKWGLSWQIPPRVLSESMALGGDAAKRVFVAMMEMQKIDVAMIEAAVHGKGRLRTIRGEGRNRTNRETAEHQ